MSEGWVIIRSGLRGQCIQKDDEEDIFQTDFEAQKHALEHHLAELPDNVRLYDEDDNFIGNVFGYKKEIVHD